MAKKCHNPGLATDKLVCSALLAVVMLTGCNGGGGGSGTATETSPITYVKASNPGVGYSFGFSIALSADGSTLAVGAVGEASNATGINGNQKNTAAGAAGAVYVFTRSGDTWAQQAYVKASNTNTGDFFGSSVALSGDGTTLAVGAVGEASNATGINHNETDNSIGDSGAVYVFTRSGDTWTQQAYVKASNTQTGALFGTSVTLSGDGTTLAVGAVGEASNAVGINNDQTDISAAAAGAVYVFTRSGDTWAQQAYVKAYNTDANDRFGSSIALSGDGTILAVGAPLEDSSTTDLNSIPDNSAADAGAVYVFTRTGDAWTQQAYVKASNTDAGDTFGTSVVLSGDGATLAVGAIGEASFAFGIDGEQGDNEATGSGAVYVLTRSGNTWTQQAYVKASNPEPGYAFGESITMSTDGDSLAVSAIAEGSSATGINGIQADFLAGSAGAVYTFTRNAGAWAMQTYVKASNTEAGDDFGTSIALSGDGTTLVVGAINEASRAVGINGNQTDNSAGGSGAVYVY